MKAELSFIHGLTEIHRYSHILAVTAKLQVINWT